MVKRIFPLIFLIIISGILFTTCQRSLYSSNQLPIARAGKDTVIILPTDFVKLDGSASSDPDGSIKEWHWTKISGPSSFTIVNAISTITDVKNLAAGVYQFELKVIDNGRLSAKDTMQVTVISSTATNHAPIANAGKDTLIFLPANSVTLDGTASTDPDNNITGYLWTKISGPSIFNINNSGSAKTQVSNLVEGNYAFELKVTDAGGLFSRDTVRVNVNAANGAACDNSNRQQVSAQLVPFGILPEARTGMTAVSGGNKILFAGGYAASTVPGGSGQLSSRVDIYDITTQKWTVAALSQAVAGIKAITLGNKIFFAGGDISAAFSSSVDIYDVVTNSWTKAELTLARRSLSIAVAGNKVLFAGGYYQVTTFSDFVFSNWVDIYDASTGSWSTATLSQARSDLTATTVGNKIYFAGGTDLWNPNDYDCTKSIDIFDASNNSWSTSSLAEAKGGHAAIAVGNKIYWAGGRTNTGNYPYSSCVVEIRDLSTQTLFVC